MRPTTGTPAIPAEALFDGEPIPTAGVLTLERQPRRVITPTVRRREQIAYTGPGGEANPVRRSWKLSWSHLGASAPLVDRLLARPGPHELETWQNEALVFAGDGGRTQWLLPWRHALDVRTPPGVADPSHFDPELRFSASGPPVTMLRKSTEDYDAGDPGADEVWFEVVTNPEAAVRWKILEPPDKGTYLWVDVVPAFAVFADGSSESRSHQAPIAQPRSVTLVEA
ncbi:MAG TPA: hypothetical protein VGS22_16480 [Thermoanaerobaculia bacterium]|jgi:hypothetical protein|nr:hypothetical protein [Thermoanaerobaculia bacterium]